jgi:hypothetical protein
MLPHILELDQEDSVDCNGKTPNNSYGRRPPRISLHIINVTSQKFVVSSEYMHQEASHD